MASYTQTFTAADTVEFDVNRHVMTIDHGLGEMNPLVVLYDMNGHHLGLKQQIYPCWLTALDQTLSPNVITLLIEGDWQFISPTFTFYVRVMV